MKRLQITIPLSYAGTNTDRPDGHPIKNKFSSKNVLQKIGQVVHHCNQVANLLIIEIATRYVHLFEYSQKKKI
jgi:hypothetical protein